MYDAIFPTTALRGALVSDPFCLPPRVSPRQAFLNVSAEYYPERLGLFVIVDAPKLFSVLWKAVRKFVDPKTRRKVGGGRVPWGCSVEGDVG